MMNSKHRSTLRSEFIGSGVTRCGSSNCNFESALPVSVSWLIHSRFHWTWHGSDDTWKLNKPRAGDVMRRRAIVGFNAVVGWENAGGFRMQNAMTLLRTFIFRANASRTALNSGLRSLFHWEVTRSSLGRETLLPPPLPAGLSWRQPRHLATPTRCLATKHATQFGERLFCEVINLDLGFCS